MKVTLELKNVDGQMQLESVQSIRLFDSDDDDIKYFQITQAGVDVITMKVSDVDLFEL